MDFNLHEFVSKVDIDYITQNELDIFERYISPSKSENRDYISKTVLISLIKKMRKGGKFFVSCHLGRFVDPQLYAGEGKKVSNHTARVNIDGQLGQMVKYHLVYEDLKLS